MKTTSKVLGLLVSLGFVGLWMGGASAHSIDQIDGIGGAQSMEKALADSNDSASECTENGEESCGPLQTDIRKYCMTACVNQKFLCTTQCDREYPESVDKDGNAACKLRCDWAHSACTKRCPRPR